MIGAVGREIGGAGRTALRLDGDAISRRLIVRLSTNLSLRGHDADAAVRRHEFALFFGARHSLDRFEGTEFAGTALWAGSDARIGVGERIELGASATVRTNLEDDTTRCAFGPTVGLVPVDGMLLTVGYNVEGFRDGDFARPATLTRAPLPQCA